MVTLKWRHRFWFDLSRLWPSKSRLKMIWSQNHSVKISLAVFLSSCLICFIADESDSEVRTGPDHGGDSPSQRSRSSSPSTSWQDSLSPSQRSLPSPPHHDSDPQSQLRHSSSRSRPDSGAHSSAMPGKESRMTLWANCTRNCHWSMWYTRAVVLNRGAASYHFYWSLDLF